LDKQNKTISGFFWSFVDSFSTIIIQFVIGIILARLLSVKEFGLIGILTLFINISTVIIDSGFKIGLLRRVNCTNKEYSTIFYFNISVSFLLYLVLFFSAGYVSAFFKEPILKLPMRVISLGLLFNSFGLIQSVILLKNIDFKKQASISVTAITVSGLVAVGMAYSGFGIWSLVALNVIRTAINTILLWLKSTWVPALVFCKKSFNEIYSFSKNLLFSGLISTIYENAYYFVIGKFFSTTELGYYTRAEQFKYIPSQGMTEIINRVSFPVLSSIQDNPVALKEGYKKLIKITMFISFVFMIGMASISESLIIFLIGEKWIVAAEYLRLLSFVGMVYPFQALNLSMLQLKGRSDLFLRLDIIKKSLAIPAIIMGIIFGIKIMLYMMIFNAFISFFLDSFYSGKMINYPVTEQIKDIYLSFVVAIIMGISIYLIKLIFNQSNTIILLAQLVGGVIVIIVLGELIKKYEYIEIKSIIKGYILKIKN